MILIEHMILIDLEQIHTNYNHNHKRISAVVCQKIQSKLFTICLILNIQFTDSKISVHLITMPGIMYIIGGTHHD
jgi:hypothetical protein